MKQIKFYLHKVTVDDKDVLFRLLQYSLFEESATDGNQMGQNGLFEYRWFDAYFTEPAREAFLIREKETNNLLGFAMVCNHVRTLNVGHSIAEFMVLPPYRRNGIGKRVAHQLFEMHTGGWEVKPSVGSKSAKNFWKNTIQEYTNSDFIFQSGVFVFENKKAQK